MRSKLYAFILVAASACAPAKGPEVCKPISSWGQPVYRCSPITTAEAAPVEKPAPEEPKTKVESDEIKLRDKVQFETDSAVLLPQSKTILDEVATILKDNPGLTKVRIDGHTDSTSTPEHNQTLSEQRANSVRDYLVSKGIAAGRLTPVGHGQDKPIGDNTTDEGRYQNRRVEFHITERKP
jgi:OOP family OmpA-OmpF porin